MRTLDNFITNHNTICGEFNYEVITALKSLIDLGNFNFSPLLISGNVGVGKSHILNVVKEYMNIYGNSKRDVLYFDTKGISTFLIDTFEQNAYERLKRVEKASVILIDDVHRYGYMNFTQEYMLNFISASRELKIPIIVSGDNHPNRVNGFDPSLLSKLCGGLAIQIDLPDFKSKVAFINKLAKERNLIIEKQVVERVVDSFTSDFSVLSGIVNKFELFSTLTKQESINDSAFRYILNKR